MTDCSLGNITAGIDDMVLVKLEDVAGLMDVNSFDAEGIGADLRLGSLLAWRVQQLLALAWMYGVRSLDAWKRWVFMR